MVFHGCVVMRPSTAMVIETMDGGAFGSLVAAVNVANTGMEVWDRESSKLIVPDYFKIPVDQHIGIYKCRKEAQWSF
jgi:hypothetical protein